jgi:hypothetical protein
MKLKKQYQFRQAYAQKTNWRQRYVKFLKI